MIFKGSRYEGVGVYTTTDANGRTVQALGIRIIPPTPAGHQYTVTAADRLDLMAYSYYLDALKFWLIADANTEMDPDDLLVPGRLLLIPPDRT